MARVTPASPEIGVPCASAALPVKFTRRGTGADDCVVALCWAAARKQDIEIARIMESEYLPDFIRSSFSGHSRQCSFWSARHGQLFDLSALLRDIWLF